MKETNVKYQATIYACFLGYIVQVVVNNFVPLLFLHFIVFPILMAVGLFLGTRMHKVSGENPE